jgi:hypothetical protein
MSSNAGAVNHVAREGDADMTPSAAAPQAAATSGTHLDGSGILPFRIEVPYRDDHPRHDLYHPNCDRFRPRVQSGPSAWSSLKIPCRRSFCFATLTGTAF